MVVVYWQAIRRSSEDQRESRIEIQTDDVEAAYIQQRDVIADDPDVAGAVVEVHGHTSRTYCRDPKHGWIVLAERLGRSDRIRNRPPSYVSQKLTKDELIDRYLRDVKMHLVIMLREQRQWPDFRPPKPWYVPPGFEADLALPPNENPFVFPLSARFGLYGVFDSDPDGIGANITEQEYIEWLRAHRRRPPEDPNPRRS